MLEELIEQYRPTIKMGMFSCNWCDCMLPIEQKNNPESHSGGCTYIVAQIKPEPDLYLRLERALIDVLDDLGSYSTLADYELCRGCQAKVRPERQTDHWDFCPMGAAEKVLAWREGEK